MQKNRFADIQSDFAQWYQDVIAAAELVDHSPVRGSMVIRPYGYALWEHIKQILDKKIKESGHHNAAFPLLIPESFFKREQEHVEGFAPELAVVTHAGGKILEEPLVVRPTSETIIHYMFARWIKSWRDLPLKINQWANVIRWELRPRAFLRTTEFFWQEGHTAHETLDEAIEEADDMLRHYVDLARSYLAIPVITGVKTAQEKFPGALKTLTFEAIMQDGKALQMGTSHLLSQSFAHAFAMQFQDRSGNMSYPYLTSWGATTRLVGAVVMVHGDQRGLVLPPRIAPVQVVIIPIASTTEPEVREWANALGRSLAATCRVWVDQDDQKTPGAKFYHWEVRGVPIRIEVGKRELALDQVTIVSRVDGRKSVVKRQDVCEQLELLKEQIQAQLLARAEERLKHQWHRAEKLALFGPILEKQNGLYQTGWCGNAMCENELKKYHASSRCVLPDSTFAECFHCSSASDTDIIVAKAY